MAHQSKAGIEPVRLPDFKTNESPRGGSVSMACVLKSTSTTRGFCGAWLENSDETLIKEETFI